MKRLLNVLVILGMFLAGSASISLGAPLNQDEDQRPEPTPNRLVSPIYLPLIMGIGGSYSISGKVIDSGGHALSGVTITDQNGRNTQTDSSGNYALTGLSAGQYALAPNRPGSIFSPSVLSVNVPPGANEQNFIALDSCNEIRNSSFENNNAWDIPITVYSARYSTVKVHTGFRSMRTGIVDPFDNRFSYSDAGQWVTIPSNATNATLRLWGYPSSDELGTDPLPEPPAIGKPFGLEALSGDVQYVLVLDQYSNVIKTLLWQRSDSRTWNYYEFNLKKYIGKTIKIQFGTFNNGISGITSMYVDDVTLDACPPGTPTATPTPGPTPTVTPTPTGCAERIDNGGFEWNDDWYIPVTEFSAGYSTERAYNGDRSMRTGIVYPPHNRYSYSDAAQVVSIPSSADQVDLRMWIYSSSGESADLALPEIPTGVKFGTQALSSDVQYVLILDQYGNWIDTLLWQRSNARYWKAVTFNLDHYAGKTIRLQFGTYNDGWGGVTSMYVDDVSIEACP